MPVCRFYTAGYCKFGDHCRNEHPGHRSAPVNARNPFGPLQNTNNSRQPVSKGPSNSRNLSQPYKLDKDRIVADLTKDRPRYILSAYGPEKEIPIQLFGGYPREQSFEELRLRHYELAFGGNQQQAIQEAQSLFTSAEQQIQTALNDIEGAIKYMIDAENQHPNRFDICQGKAASTIQNPDPGTFQQGTPAFGKSSSTSGFGQPSSLGQQPSVFGQQQPVVGQTSAFGQTAQLGRPTTSSFGQPTSTVGKPAALAPSFGQPTIPAPVFGQPSAPSTLDQGSRVGQQAAPAFGASSAFGSSQQATASFSQTNSTFGQPSVLAQQNVFGRPAAPSTNPLNQHSAPPATSVFSQPTPATANPFAKPAATTTLNPFGKPNTSSSTLSQPSGQISNVLGPNTNSAFVKPTVSQPSIQPQPAHATYAGDRLAAWKGKPVTYVDDVPCVKAQDGNLEKVLFPNGPPSLKKSPDLPDELYNESTKENYRFMKEHGRFRDGIMPNLPPKKEWCTWDF